MRLLLTSFIAISILTSAMANDKKYDRLMSRADAFYDHFSYKKAVEWYEKALEVKDIQDPKIQIANSYRKLNDPESALEWYEAALEHGEMADGDMLHYGQILSILERYDEAHEVLNKFHQEEEWVEGRAEGFKKVELFYHNEIAFEIRESIFNSEQADFSPIFKDDGLVFVTGRPSKGMLKPKYNADNTLFLNLFEVKEGEEPVKMERGINTRFHEGPSVFYAGDKKMIFTRNNYHEHKAGKSEDGVNHLKLFLSEKDASGEWENPEEFEYNDDNYSVGHPSVSPDGSTLYMASDMPGGFGGVDIYRSYWEGGKWSAPVNMGEVINTARDEMFPYISEDGFLYFASDGHRGLGGLDIFRVELARSNSKPRNLGYSLNTNKDDFGIVLNANGNKGYLSSNRAGGTGDDDIYEVFIYDFIVTVNLKDDVTKELIEGSLQATDTFLEEIVRDQSGVSSIVFPAIKGDIFTVSGIAPEYFEDSLIIETRKDSSDVRRIEFDIFLKKVEELKTMIYVVNVNGLERQVLFIEDEQLVSFDGSLDALQKDLMANRVGIDSTIYLENVLYDFDKSKIRADAEVALDKWVTFLNQYPSKNVSLTAHTDLRATNAYNEKLAKRRVKSAKKYLTKAGIDKERLMDDSFGETKPFEGCGEEECDEVQHQNNRRTEILIEE